MLRKILLCFLCYGSISFNLHAQQFKAGDLVFQDLHCGPLCDAINAVTKGYNGQDFSHVGIVVNYNDQLGVIEAIGSHVQFTKLESFLNRSLDAQNHPRVMAGRLRNKYQASIAPACSLAIAKLGIPYDDRFLPNNDSLYCSELIYAVFLQNSNGKPLFKLQPMTYKQPGSNRYFPAWIKYYADLQTAIPEGKMGLNPGLISRSKKIKIVYQNGTWLQ